MRYLDHALNRVTMYRLVLYYLLVLLTAGFIASFLGVLPFSPYALLFSSLLITIVCWGTNWIFARVWKVAPNVESVYISALILALIITPPSFTIGGVGFLVFASVWAMASKYLLAISKKHLFNPAAFAVALAALLLGQSATWWVGGNVALLPFVLAGGLLIVRKIQRFDLVASFAIVALVATVLTSASGSVLTPLVQTFLHSSFFFFAFVMLTEPATTPPQRTWRILYGALVGLLFAPNIHVGNFYFTPELALIVGNMFAYIVSPKGRYTLTLKRVEQIAKDTYDFAFKPDRPLTFLPGQYLEWTLGHPSPDSRGNRRYFTIASSPTEKEVHLGVKFYTPGSTFKKALVGLKAGDTLTAAMLAGDFVLPQDPYKKIVFIAGGIGITPFRSMIQYLVDRKERRPITLLYANTSASDIAYRHLFERAHKELGIRTVYVEGTLAVEQVVAHIPHYRESLFYLSGPRRMVETFEDELTALGVSPFHIKTDFFPGFA